MPRKPEDSVFYGRYCLTTEAYGSLKKELRRLYNGATAILDQGIADKVLRDYLQEVHRLTLRDLEDLRNEVKQFK